MTEAECREFEANPFAEAARRLRRWDDQAKIPELPTPSLTHYRPFLEAALDGTT